MQRFGRVHTFLCRLGISVASNPTRNGRRCGVVNFFMQPSRAAFFAGRVISEGGDGLSKTADHAPFYRVFFTR
tara:strand:+ start:102 stop:320 length:219 start_codon:yes stop_codon:yes gene_type:complete